MKLFLIILGICVTRSVAEESDPCPSRTCGGWGLRAGEHTDNVCLIGEIVIVEVNCNTWIDGLLTVQNLCLCRRTCREERAEKHTCCDGSLDVTAKEYNRRTDVPICVKPGLEPGYSACPSPERIYCGGCSKQWRSRWGIQSGNGVYAFQRVETLESRCRSKMCTKCAYWPELLGECAPPGQCCEGSQPEGDECIPKVEPIVAVPEPGETLELVEPAEPAEPVDPVEPLGALEPVEPVEPQENQ